jgi:Raf kinase inhibitor-like YbhB/YbcL family protein
MKRALLVVVLTACGSDSSPEKPPIDAPDEVVPDGPPDAPMPPDFILTSSAYTEGGTIPTAHTCDGADSSPQLSWTGTPSGTMSYAILFTDKDNSGLLHWAIWDIPGSATGLPENVEKMFMPSNVAGARQSSYQSPTKGYLGPCPPTGTTHNYELVLYAIDVATLPGTSMTTTPGQARTIIDAHDLASAKLAATYTRP